MESGHAGSTGTSSSGENVANRDVLDEFRIEVNVCVGSAENMGEEKFRMSILPTTLSCLEK